MYRIKYHECNAEPTGSGVKCNKCGNVSRGECGRTLPAYELVEVF